MTQAIDTRDLERRLKASADYIDDIKARTGANTVMEEGAQKLFREAAATIAELRATVAEAVRVMEPFATCCEQIDEETDDEEWAKFRLIVAEYRAARAFTAKHGGSNAAE